MSRFLFPLASASAPAAPLRAWLRRVASCVLLAGGLLALVGCGGASVQPMVPDDAFPPAKSEDYNMRCFKNTVARAHRDIAWIDSTAQSDRGEQAWEAQLEELREAAREIGADAVHNVTVLRLKARGATIDRSVPFTAIKQDRYDLYFLRGTATVYLGDDANAKQAAAASAAAEAESAPPATAPALFAPASAPSTPPPGATNRPRSAASEAEGHNHSASDDHSDGDEVSGDATRKKKPLSNGVAF